MNELLIAIQAYMASCDKLIKPYCGPNCLESVNAVYYSPQTLLRMQADELDRTEELNKKCNDAREKLHKALKQAPTEGK
jgi:hypothetical protein